MAFSTHCRYLIAQSFEEIGCKITYLEAVLRIHDILVWIQIRIWIRGSMPLTNGSERMRNPDPASFVLDLQEANKKLIF
jgi:hypothetical protein